jgi:ribosomal protein S4E
MNDRRSVALGAAAHRSRYATRAIFRKIGAMTMKGKPSGKLKDGAKCKVIGGAHAGKSGRVRDIETGKTGYVSITVVQSNGERFKTLAKNVVI